MNTLNPFHTRQYAIDRLINGETNTVKIAECARGRMKSKKEQIIYALEGKVTPHHCFMLTQQRDEIRFLDDMIKKFDQHIDEHINAQGENFAQLIPLLTTIKGS